jgi:hypothetical protein
LIIPCQNGEIPERLRMLLIRPKMSTPAITPSTRPTPPNRLPPPTTTAAMLSSS